MNYNQYEVVLVNLDPTVGSEIQKTRPCLIISPKEMNFSNLMVAPLTSKHRDYPTRVQLQKDSFVVLDRIRTVSCRRVIKRLDIRLSKKNIDDIKNIIKIMLVD